MATKTLHDWAALEEVTAANMDAVSASWLGYAENSSDQTGITSTGVDVTDVTISVTANSSRRLLIFGTGHVSETAASASTVTGDILEDGSSIGRWARGSIAASAVEQYCGFATATPAAGAHTYKLQVSRASGSGTFTVSGSGAAKAKIMVLDVGSTS